MVAIGLRLLGGSDKFNSPRLSAIDEAVELVLDLGGLVALGLSDEVPTSEPSSEVIDGVGVRRCTLKVNRNL